MALATFEASIARWRHSFNAEGVPHWLANAFGVPHWLANAFGVPTVGEHIRCFALVRERLRVSN